MSRVKNPVEKKKLSLAKDYRTFALEGGKTFRKAWRTKKTKAARQLRRAQAKADRLYQSTDEIDSVVRKRPRPLKKIGVMSLSQMISFKRREFGPRWGPLPGTKNKRALKAVRRKLRKLEK